MKIAVDLDEVLSQSMPALIKYHNDKYGTSLKTEDFKSYKFEEIWGGNLIEAINKVNDFHQSKYFDNVLPVKGAKEVLEKLKKNNELFILTARSEDMREKTEKFVEKYFPKIFSKIYFTNHFALNGTETTKKEMCDTLDIDVLIEDNIKYAGECATEKRKIYLMDYPWNQSDKLPKNVIRVHSWQEIGKKI